jgi:hypothetical protein
MRATLQGGPEGLEIVERMQQRYRFADVRTVM